MRLRIDHFGLVARWYDRFIGGAAEESLAAHLALSPGDLLLDVGGGTGRNAAALAGARVVLCDLSRGMLAQAQRRGLTAVQASATRLPFPDGCAHRVLIVDALHHIVDPVPAEAQPAAVHELVRVLAPGGRLVVAEPDIDRPGVRAVVWMEWALLMGSRFRRPAEWESLFQAAGARVLERSADGMNAWLVFARS